MRPSKDIADLIEIMARLRTPVTGCPWDLEQDFASIAPYTIEEAYEVADAIARDDPDDLRDELGDLLLQVVFHARMAEEQRRFAFGDVVEAITAKMIRRHPHVFGNSEAADPAAVKRRWDEIKMAEKAERASRRANSGSSEPDAGLLADVPASLPGLTQAVKLQKRAGTVGFDWNNARAVLDKIREETDEFSREVSAPSPEHGKLEDELGDLLFAVANLARHVSVDPEAALRRANQKFRRRFAHIERGLAKQKIELGEASLDEMEALWTEAKRLEKQG